MNNDEQHSGSDFQTTVKTLVLVVVCILLVAGLWPFRAPRNAVNWLNGQNGVRFGRHGTLISRDAFHLVSPENDGSCTLEIWLTPRRASSGGVIMAFDSSPDPHTPFSLRQYGNAIAAQRYVMDHGIAHRPWLRVDGILHQGEQSFVAVTSGLNMTSIYVNGVLESQSPTFGMVSHDLTGRLVVGNSPVGDSWEGEVTRLAVYDRKLTPTEIKMHLENPDYDSGSNLSDDQKRRASYLFNERQGNIIHNQVPAETDLLIPAEYVVLHRELFRPPWDNFNDSGAAWRQRSYWKDIVVNIVGFVPLGFVVMAYSSSASNSFRAALVTIVVGLALSITIEALQYFLPTRDSSVSDLITNTAGTSIGLALWRMSWVRRVINRIRHQLFQRPFEQSSSSICRPEVQDTQCKVVECDSSQL